MPPPATADNSVLTDGQRPDLISVRSGAVSDAPENIRAADRQRCAFVLKTGGAMTSARFRQRVRQRVESLPEDPITRAVAATTGMSRRRDEYFRRYIEGRQQL